MKNSINCVGHLHIKGLDCHNELGEMIEFGDENRKWNVYRRLRLKVAALGPPGAGGFALVLAAGVAAVLRARHGSRRRHDRRHSNNKIAPVDLFKLIANY